MTTGIKSRIAKINGPDWKSAPASIRPERSILSSKEGTPSLYSVLVFKAGPVE